MVFCQRNIAETSFWLMCVPHHLFMNN